MTDRAKGCYVSFDRDIRVDDVEWMVNAIKMIKGVSGVELSITDSGDWMAREHVKTEIKDKLLTLYREL